MFFVDRATLSDETENENIQYGSDRDASKHQIKKAGGGANILYNTRHKKVWGIVGQVGKKKGSEVINERYDNNKIQEGLNKSILITLSKKPGASEFHTPSNNQIHEPHD